MNKPYIICHMMTSLDARIDCKMTEELKGSEDYYKTLDLLNVDSHISGRNTAELEMKHNGKFELQNSVKYNKIDFKKNKNTNHFEIIFDTFGSLKYSNEENSCPYLIVTSENVSKDYIAYLNKENISWISCGKDKIDLNKALEILKNEFGQEKIALLGGSKINTSFLDNNLIDEISVLIGAGIDARAGYPTLFDSRENNKKVYQLNLKEVKSFNSGAVWIRYTI